MPPPPDPLFFLRGATKGQGCIHPARAKDRIPLLSPPAAARCSLNEYLLLQERSRLMLCPRVAVRWSLHLRGWWQDTQNCHEHAPAPGPYPPAVSSTAGLFWRRSFQVTANPRGVHPIGGTAVPPDWSFQGVGFTTGRGKSKSRSPLTALW